MWVKALGSILIVLGCGVWGLLEAKKIRRRMKQIKELRLALNFLEKDITLMYVPLAEALDNTGDFCNGGIGYFFKRCAQFLQEKSGITAGEAWRLGLTELKKHSALREVELHLLEGVADQIGVSEVKEQQKCLDLVNEQLKMIEAQNYENMENQQKLWIYGGFVLGTVTVLLLI
ncbi:MAG: hypothetical protein LBK69_04210 [Syntrophomonadaceae bacterium]|jgi:stage III sporulation protein AB|nr:hypothetical protein [Syntrophomonadaceae bacterium]